ncbi:MAG: phytoene desaturase [Chitinophagaceae bacterium]|nr:phytoene desaturase [Chitinophagaceae bacterium]
MNKRKLIVIGSGFAGLSAASFMAKQGWQVTVIEKNDGPGGRARQLKEQGFVFDMGPSFYWMPDIFERYFEQFGRKASDYYQLERLDPSYRVYWSDGFTDMSADFEQLKKTFESIEPGSSVMLEKYLDGAAYKYEVGIKKLVFKPGRSLLEFMDWQTITGVFRLQVFNNIKKHIAGYFKTSRLRQLMEFPVLFLGALPEDTPALYSLMNYADIKGGTWYPKGGMYAVVEGMYKLALELGVEFKFNEAVTKMELDGKKISSVQTDKGHYEPEAVISGADYHFTETNLLPAASRSYTEKYWDKKIMAPSCLMYYVGLNKKLKNVVHHGLFFDVPFDQHGQEIYKDPKWPASPLFYSSVASVTDEKAAPAGQESIVFLIPVASGLEGDSVELRKHYFDIILARMEKHLGEPIRDSIVYYKDYSVKDFKADYNSFKGNAYGLANTLLQTAIFRPSCESKRVRNLFYTGQLTVPGPGVPPSLISGEVVARQLIKRLG